MKPREHPSKVQEKGKGRKRVAGAPAVPRDWNHVLKSSSNIIFVKDTQGRYLYVNPQFQKLCALTRTKILGKTDREVFPAQQAAAFEKNDQEVIHSGKSLTFEEVALQEDGLRTSLVNKFPVRDARGKVYAVCGIVTDITERQRQAEAVSRSQEMFEQLFEAAPDGILTVNEAGQILRVNTQAEAMFGYRREELEGRAVEILIPRHLRSRHPLHRRNYASDPRMRPMGAGLSLFARRKDGTELPVDISLSPLATEAGPQTLAVIRDIRPRKQAEEALRQSEQRYRQLMESVKDYAIMLLDAEGRILTANFGAQQIFGYSYNELLGRHVAVLYPPRDRAKADAELAAAAREGQSEVEGLRMRKDGAPFWANVLTACLHDIQGSISGYSKVVHDITNRKEAEDHSRFLAMRRIQMLDEERRRISRELHDTTGSSLTALLLNLAMIQRLEMQLAPEAQKALQASLAMAKQCAAEVRTLAYDLHPPMLEEAGLEAALEWYLENFSRLTGIEVQTRISAPPGTLAKEMEVSLYHLVRQAMLNVHRHSSSRTAKVDLQRTPGTLVLQIADQGKGMPQGSREGLGIRGMKERVQLFNGTLEIASSSQGTALTITLPLPPASSRVRPKASPALDLQCLAPERLLPD